ncbi:hypothetical protein H7K62_17495 [Quadrisphaera sp. RL12-1S]|nr:hypothetical protein [Quadrisphaera sp. RL12-1S]MBC3763487.1 hypothetical protein [Quadrisphaera sp. RL12-1S]
MVVVCRGGECGSRSKHPGVDHADQLRRIRAAADTATAAATATGGRADVAVSSCLDACERSNVVVVVPGARDRADGVTPVWVGPVLQEDATEDLAGWLLAGGPSTPAPPLVDILAFQPTRTSRRELEEPGTLSGRAR